MTVSGSPSRSFITVVASSSSSLNASRTGSPSQTVSVTASRTKSRSKRVPRPATRVPTRQPTTFRVATPVPPSTVSLLTPNPGSSGNTSGVANAGTSNATTSGVSNLGIGMIALAVVAVVMIGIGGACILFRRHLEKKKQAKSDPEARKAKQGKQVAVAIGAETHSEISSVSDATEMRKIPIEPTAPVMMKEDDMHASSDEALKTSPKRKRIRVKFDDDDVEYADFGSLVYNGSPESYLLPHRQGMEEPPPEYDDENDAADRQNPDLTELERVKRREMRRDAKLKDRELTFGEVKGLMEKYHPLIPNSTPGNEGIAIAKKISNLDVAEDRALRLYRYLEAEKASTSRADATQSHVKTLGRSQEVADILELPWINGERHQAIIEREFADKVNFRRSTGRDDASIMSDERTLQVIQEHGSNFDDVVGHGKQLRRYRPSSSRDLASVASFSTVPADWRSNATSDRGSVKFGDESLASPGSVKKKKAKNASSSRALATASNASDPSGGPRGSTRQARAGKWCSIEEEDLFQHSASPMERLRNVTLRANSMSKQDESESSSDSDTAAALLRMRFRQPRPKYDPAEASFRGLDLDRYDPDL